MSNSGISLPTGRRTPEDTPALRLMRAALHGTFFVLLAVALGPAAVGTESALLLVPGIALGLVYGAGALRERREPSQAWVRGWLAVVTALWVGLLLADRDFSYVVFPLFFLHLHVLPPRWSLPSVGAATALIVVVQSHGPDGFTAAKVIGPTAGAAVAVLTAYGYAALYRESRQRRRLIDDLVTTRDELAAAQREAGRLAERQRLAREIHDTLAQGLSSIVLLTRAADSALPAAGAGTETARARIQEAGRTASENLAEARRFVQDLTPSALEDAALPEALRRVTAGFGSGPQTAPYTAPKVAFRLDGDPYPLPIEAEVALLRLTQEALANVARHARARNAAVTLVFLDGQVTLDVYDDGVGFTPQDPKAPQAPLAAGERATFGLHGMRERIAELGGTLTVESAPGEGTAVAAALPVPLSGPVSGPVSAPLPEPVSEPVPVRAVVPVPRQGRPEAAAAATPVVSVER
ncbi:sensor histidine kinase [Streptomyces sp. H10-C2]|uniref:sensor histidine kinase n=1 Tax=unclassified Streptomyces TaxID=2593676 RepID=UPI0024BA3AF3|nr:MULTISPECIES: sensor histidine kinase [unclassified Streptomyces]MDJ0340682.1 sensor histidine kinase [Streptomyces sp. PH10-H1]MDJ0372046.1 sensor histidine kinase [Streptomyces sp. H10-C2]